MFHPVTGGSAMVPTSAIPIRTRKGWVLPTEPDVEPDVTPDDTYEEN